MNRAVLDELANWCVDCLMKKNAAKAKKIEKVYQKMFDLQWNSSRIKNIFFV